MDYIWARLPIITTEGDSIAKLVKEENIGEVIKYEKNEINRIQLVTYKVKVKINLFLRLVLAYKI